MAEPSRRPPQIDDADTTAGEAAEPQPLPRDNRGLVDVARLVAGEIYATDWGRARYDGLDDDGAAVFAELLGAPLTAPEQPDRAAVIEGIAKRRDAERRSPGSAPERWGWRGYTDDELAAIAAAVPIPIEKVRAARDALDNAGAWHRMRALTRRLNAVARAARQEPPRADLLSVALGGDLSDALIMQALAGEVRDGGNLTAVWRDAIERALAGDDKAARKLAAWAEAATNRSRLTPSLTIRRLDAIAKAAHRIPDRPDLLARALGFRSRAEARATVMNGLLDRWVFRLLASTVKAPDAEPMVLATCEKALNDKATAAARKKAAQQLARWAKVVVKSIKSLGKLVAARGRSEDVALNGWVAATIGIYEQVTGRRAGTSVGGAGLRHEGEAIGPLVRFFAASGVPLGIELGSDGWRKRVRDVLSATKSPRNKKAMFARPLR